LNHRRGSAEEKTRETSKPSTSAAGGCVYLKGNNDHFFKKNDIFFCREKY